MYFFFANFIQRAVVLTVVVDGERHIARGDLVEADLAVLRRAVCVQGLHLDNAVKEATLWHRGLIVVLHKHGGELVYVIHAHMHCGPVCVRQREREGQREMKSCSYWVMLEPT